MFAIRGDSPQLSCAGQIQPDVAGMPARDAGAPEWWPAAPGDQLAAVCERHGIVRLALFGSVLKDVAHAASDVDLLVEFAPDRKPGLLGMAAIEKELSARLGGRRVALRTAAELSRYFREEVLREAEDQYAA